MDQKSRILSIVITVWLLMAAIVIGYPLIKGQIKVGVVPVSREVEPRRFWTAYLVSTMLFLLVSAAAGFFVRGILHTMVK